MTPDDGHARTVAGVVLCRTCRRQPASERVVYEGRNVLGNQETIAHALCARHVDGYVALVRDLGWTLVGLTDVDDGPLGSSLLARVAVSA